MHIMLLSLRGRVVPGIVHVSTYLHVVFVQKKKKGINIQDVCAPDSIAIHVYKLDVRKKIPYTAFSQNHEFGAFGNQKILDTRILHPGNFCQSFSSKYSFTVFLSHCFLPKNNRKTEKMLNCPVLLNFQFRSVF